MKHLTIRQLQRIEHDLIQEIEDNQYFSRPLGDLPQQLRQVQGELQSRVKDTHRTADDADVDLILSTMQLIQADIDTLRSLATDARNNYDPQAFRQYNTSISDLTHSLEILRELKNKLQDVRSRLTSHLARVQEFEAKVAVVRAEYERVASIKGLDIYQRIDVEKLHRKLQDAEYDPIWKELQLLRDEEAEVLRTIRRHLNIKQVAPDQVTVEVFESPDPAPHTPTQQREAESELDQLRAELAQAIAEGEPKQIIRKIQRRIDEIVG